MCLESRAERPSWNCCETLEVIDGLSYGKMLDKTVEKILEDRMVENHSVCRRPGVGWPCELYVWWSIRLKRAT